MASESDLLALLARISITDQNAARNFGVGICSIIGAAVMLRWCSALLHHPSLARNTSACHIIYVARPLRRLSTGIPVKGLLVLPGQMLLAFIYFAISGLATFIDVDWTQRAFFAKRLGWMTLCNLCLTVFLGLKNTPLLPLMGHSYESINGLHRCCGYTTILYMAVHAILYLSSLDAQNQLWLMRIPQQYAAGIAGLSMLLILASATSPIRKRQYELFVTVHVALVATILVTAGVHTHNPPYVSTRTLIIVGLAVALWITDRLIRSVRWIFYAYGNHCTVELLPEEATRVTLSRSIKARPGSHVFLYIPGIRMFQTHPFTLVSNDPAEFVIAARDGFTKSLHEVANVKSPNRWRASVDGPYGMAPAVRQYDKLVLVAGGSGVTFTMALAVDWSRHTRLRKHKSTMVFVWIIRTRAYLQWFKAELAELSSNLAVDLQIYMTASDSLPSLDKPTTLHGSCLPELPSSTYSSSADPEKEPKHGREPFLLEQHKKSSSCVTSLRSDDVRQGRPEAEAIVENAIAGIPRHKRVLIAASGPPSMLADVRLAASLRMRPGLPSVDLHLEEFEW